MRAFLMALLCLSAAPALADRIPSHCVALSQAQGRVIPASFRNPVAEDQVRLTYLDHAMFLIQSEDVSAVTDFSGYIGNVDFLPDVVTMNNAHSTHWTSAPDPAIPHALPGWAEGAQPREHYLDLGAMLVRNVHTDVRAGMGMRENGNSIFVFEAAGLCIGHLGHLHHEPDPLQYALLGRIDVVMVPVDGGLTLDHATLLRVMERMRASVVIPMHWFGRGTLETFLVEMEGSGFDIRRFSDSDITLGLSDLPARPSVYLLEPAFLRE